MRVPLALGLLFGAMGCQDANKNEKASESVNQQPTISSDRPLIDFMGPYNIPRSEMPEYEGEIWAERDSLPELSRDEFFKVRADVVEALSRHGIVYAERGHTEEGPHDFFVYDDKYFDRTQKIELDPTDRLPRILPPAVADLRAALGKHPLWRAMFIGHGIEWEKSYFVVYPDVVRIRQSAPGKSDADAVAENATLRYSGKQARTQHRENRRGELKAAIARARDALNRSQDEIVLVAWFDTRSSEGISDWGLEGAPGASVWFLSRSNLPEDLEIVGLSDDVDTAFHSVAADGTVANDDASDNQALRLIHLETEDARRKRLEFSLNGKTYDFRR